MSLERNKLVTTIPVLERTFRLSFDVWLGPRGKDVWQNVIHLTTGNDYTKLPAVFIGINNKCGVAFENVWYSCSKDLKTNSWMNLEISQQLLNKKVSEIVS